MNDKGADRLTIASGLYGANRLYKGFGYWLYIENSKQKILDYGEPLRVKTPYQKRICALYKFLDPVPDCYTSTRGFRFETHRFAESLNVGITKATRAQRIQYQEATMGIAKRYKWRAIRIGIIAVTASIIFHLLPGNKKANLATNGQ